MKALRQALRDLTKELGLVLLFGFFAATVLYRTVGSVNSVGSLASSAGIVQTYQTGGIMTVITVRERYHVPEDMQVSVKGSAPEPLGQLLKHGFSRDGCLGSLAEFPFRDPSNIESILLVTGKMIDLVRFDVPQDSDFYTAVTNDLKDLVGTSVTYDGQEIRVDALLPEDDCIATLSNTVRLEKSLVVFARDYEKAYRLFWLPPEYYVNNLVAVDPDQAFMAELMRSVSAATGKRLSVYSGAEYMRLTGDAGTKHLFLRLFFFFTAALAMTLALVMGVLRLLELRKRELCVHRLFGATKRQTFLRMLFQALLFGLIPAGYTALRVLFPIGWSYETGEERLVILPSQPKTVRTMLMALGVMTALILLTVLTNYLAFQKTWQKDLRREGKWN